MATTRKKTKRTTATKRSGTDAISLLRTDHEKVSALFERFERSRQDSVKEQLARQICAELTVHAQVEEEVFYPAVREAIDDDDLMNEATVEHASAKALIAEIEGESPEDDLFDAHVTVLGEYIKHHVKEEQQEIFPRARKAGVDLGELGARIAERKRALTSQRA